MNVIHLEDIYFYLNICVCTYMVLVCHTLLSYAQYKNARYPYQLMKACLETCALPTYSALKQSKTID